MKTWITNKYEQIMNDIDDLIDEYSTSIIDEETEEEKKIFGGMDNVNIYPIITHIFSKGNDYYSMSERTFNDPADVMYGLQCFQEIIAKINKKVILVPSKELFCMFMGWTAKVYMSQLKDSMEDIKDTMQMVDDYILENQLSAGQGGYAKANLTKFRTQVANDHGHSLVTQKEQNDDDRHNITKKTKDQLLLELEKMGRATTHIDYEKRNDNGNEKKESESE